MFLTISHKYLNIYLIIIIMKITETRTAIIELISDYMDKTLNEWCLINNYFIIWNMLYWYWTECFLEEIKNDCVIYFYMTDYNNKETFYLDIDKIIWHYDITAVDSFIIWIWEELTYRVIIAWTQSKAVLDKNDNFIWNYPNKPLHLYTEEEDKQLLDLLIKLK